MAKHDDKWPDTELVMRGDGYVFQITTDGVTSLPPEHARILQDGIAKVLLAHAACQVSQITKAVGEAKP